MKEKLKRYFKEFFIFAIVLFVAMNALSYYKSLDLNKQNLEIQNFKLLNNDTFAVSKNKPIIIHFWATWCPICELEATTIEKLSKDYDVLTIAVQSGSKKMIENYLKEKKLTFPVVNDKDGFYSRKFNIKAFPTTLIFNKEKKLSFSEVGYTSGLGLKLRMYFTN